YGSLRMMSSPSDRSSSNSFRTACTEYGIAPRWTGMCSAWATSCPVAVKMAQEKSLLSLMLGEKPDLRRMTPISSAIEMREFLRISNDTGSRFSMAGLVSRIASLSLYWGSLLERVTLPASKYPLNGAIWVIIILTLSIVSSTHYANASTPSQTSAAKSALNWLSINEKADGSFEDFPQIPTPGAALALWLNNSGSPQAAKSFNWIASQLDDSSSYAWGEADIPGVMLYALGASN